MDTINALKLSLAGFVLVWLARYAFKSLRPVTRTRSSLQESTTTADEKTNAYNDITPLKDFDWSTTEPEIIYKFKPKYHLTMALENLDLSELIAMDTTYSSQIQLRRDIISQHAATTVRCNPVAESAVLELHHWLLSTYLPRRFPSIYRLNATSTRLHNSVTDQDLDTSLTSAHDALRVLGENVDTDFLLLLPHRTAVNADGHPIYHLEAFVTCFPSGFDTAKKLGLPLSGIHAPVPQYETRIARSMDRFFARLEPGRAVRRANWTVTTDDRLFAPSGTHLYAGDGDDDHGKDEAATIAARAAKVVAEDCRLRCERQTLFRLPKTGALVFSFKTYLYRLDTIRDDPELAAAMAQAIDGLGEGNAPEFKHYKSGVVWGDAVKRYLRREE